ncbi:hypothetical protein [Sphingobium sp.]|uniref:hypothetical protein n=1 Tax=Sphingobium sp. TaxID=1912891 RepID=UPI002C3AE391|nr:hypothetical protein [Sphingobium sp.]HUD94086.1 hypothetical protein [Sphingobium sp.]
MELAEHIADNWSLNGGHTWLGIEDPDGKDTRTWLPTQTLKLSSAYAAPELNDLKLGAQLRWQNTIRATVGTYRQKGYALLELMAGIRIVDHVRNVTKTRHLNSLMWGQAYYGEPRNVLARLSVEH